MIFFKVISALAVALFLLVLLNNFTDYFFPNRAARTAFNDFSAHCYEKYPNPDVPIRLDTQSPSASSESSAPRVADITPDDANMKVREECISQALASVEDQALVAQQNALIRASVVFALLLVASVLLFKTTPFLAGGLLLGGIAYTICQYFSGSMFPFGMMGMGGYGGTGPSPDVLARAELVKGGLSSAAFALLVLGHLFFFERALNLKTLSFNPSAKNPPSSPA